jgi:hypothetical protein
MRMGDKMTKELHPRTQRLHELMRDYNLDGKAIGVMVERKPIIVYQWRCQYRVIPKTVLDLLELKLSSSNRRLKKSIT